MRKDPKIMFGDIYQYDYALRTGNHLYLLMIVVYYL